MTEDQHHKPSQTTSADTTEGRFRRADDQAMSAPMTLGARSAMSAGPAHVLMAMVAAGAVILDTGTYSILGWAGLLSAVAGGRALLAWHLLKSADRPEGPDITSLRVLMIAFGLALGLCWGGIAPLTFFDLSPEARVFISLLIAGVAMAAVSVVGFSLQIYMTLFLPMVLQVVIVLIVIGDRMNLWIVCGLAIIGLLLPIYVLRVSRTIKRAFALEAERRELIEDLSRTQRILEQTLTSRTDAFAIFDPQDRLVLWNQKFEDGLGEHSSLLRKGVRFEELLRLAWQRRATTPEGEQSPDWPAWRLAQHRNPTGPFEQKIDDHWRLVNEFRMEDGSTAVVHTDITDMKLREQVRDESDALKSGVISASSDAIIIIGEDDRIVQFNEAAEVLLGHSAEEVKGRLLSETIIPSIHRERHHQGMVRYRDNGSLRMVGRTQRLDALCKNGQIKPVTLNLTRIFAGGKTFFAGFLRDASDEVRRENRLREAREVAEESSRMKAAFIDMIARDVKAPLEGLVSQLTHENRADRGIALAMTTSKALSSHLDDLLDLSDITRDGMHLEQAPFDLAGICQTVADLFAPLARSRASRLAIHLEPGTPRWVIGDPGKLRKIMVHLAGRMMGSDDARPLTINVAGHAIGQEEDVWLHIQMQQGTSRADARGNLLDSREGGFLLCQQMAGLMGGSLKMFTEGDNSRIVLSVPITSAAKAAVLAEPMTIQSRTAEDEDPATAGQAEATIIDPVTGPVAPSEKAADPVHSEPPEDSPFAGLTVLLVDDTDINRAVSRELLLRLGATVEEAASGVEALSRVAEIHPDVVLLDLTMPDMDGFATCASLRAEGWRSLPVLALTGHSVDDVREDLEQAGFTGHLLKPVRKADLLRAIRDLHLPGSAGSPTGKGSQNGADQTDKVTGPIPKSAEARRPLLDPSVLERLKADIGEDGYSGLISVFSDELRTRRGSLANSVEAADVGATEVSVHALKSTAYSFGAMALGDLAATMEVAARDHDHETLQTLLPRLQHCIDDTLDRFGISSAA